MDRHAPHDYATTNVLAWTATQTANVEPSTEDDAGADADEPPDCRRSMAPSSKQFQRAPIHRGSEHHESLLTKALQSHSDEEASSTQKARRRRSITSNFSLSSAADLTCDTGFTTPARTNSPSPRLSEVGFVPLNGSIARGTQQLKDPAIQALEKKRCISFACAAKPKTDDKASMPPPPKPVTSGEQKDVSKKPTIKFACPSRIPEKIKAPAQVEAPVVTPKPSSTVVGLSGRSPRPTVTRKLSQSPAPIRSKKWLTADSKDLESEGSRFHEFASDERKEDDWILRDDPSSKPKMTVNDTLQKENAIRKLGKEAEEEADQEEEDEENDDELGDDEENFEDEEDEDEAEEEEEEVDEDEENEEHSKRGWDDEASDGYKTDNEVGFADSEEEDDGLVLWTALGDGHRSLSGATTVYRRPSAGHHSDSSDASTRVTRTRKREKRVAIRPSTPELPDSTDFVCGTLDEDRPLEEAYISHLAARKLGKIHVIPQDIDPSFPTSEPEDEAEDLYKRGQESEEHVWLHGELEDIDQDRDRKGRRRKADKSPLRRMRSPPPKRLHSPPPKPRGRSPRKLFEQHSPRRLKSPPPAGTVLRSPAASPVQLEEDTRFKSLAFRPGLTYTKSLPRGPVLFAHLRPGHRRSRGSTVTAKEGHIRGAIDIVKGLEQKRQRRREKFYQKYCTRARKEKAQTKRPPPGQGAERMREVGLIMAGKIGQGNFVLSV
ncbi:hypothetical protein QBC47DRAFT_307232 [Echria macrotheca]|uniref:Uncharacterized protein n=1 Tax=Echria macrotheca TaxID=438768 RepID=A0AAJ0F5T4_9PEZI|nr:hypothetical protein QBC47DRAFT_307232 [Echria macrotheca]